MKFSCRPTNIWFENVPFIWATKKHIYIHIYINTWSMFDSPQKSNLLLVGWLCFIAKHSRITPSSWIYPSRQLGKWLVIPGSNRWRYVNVPYFMPYVVGIFPYLGLKFRPYIWIYMESVPPMNRSLKFPYFMAISHGILEYPNDLTTNKWPMTIRASNYLNYVSNNTCAM